MEPMKNTPQPPPRISAGDAVGVVAPASPFDRDRFDRGVAALKSMGYRPVFPDGLFSRSGYLAGSDAERAETLERLFADPEIKAIISARGGFGSMRILPLLDFETIGAYPKIFVGFSDVTALLSALGKFSRITAFHGPTVISLADGCASTRRSLVAALGVETPPVLSAAQGRVLCGGQARGPVVGGNLTTLCHLLGTPFAPDYRGCILLLEDRGEAPYRIDRMLVQMKLAGCFDGLAGVVLGGFEDCGDPGEIYRIVRETFADSAIPILAGLAVGHGKTNLTVPLGIEAVLSTDLKRLSFLSPATVAA